MFYALATKPAFWAQRLNLFVAFAPVTRVDNTTSELFKYGAKASGLIKSTLYLAHQYEILGPFESQISKITCGLLPDFCKFAEGFLITQDPKLDDTDRFQVYMGHFPAGASVQSFIHYAQEINEKDMFLYDWGSAAQN